MYMYILQTLASIISHTSQVSPSVAYPPPPPTTTSSTHYFTVLNFLGIQSASLLPLFTELVDKVLCEYSRAFPIIFSEANDQLKKVISHRTSHMTSHMTSHIRALIHGL